MELRTSFRYLAPAARVHVGSGALSQLHEEAKRAGARRAFVIASNTLSQTTDLVEKVKVALGELYAGLYDGAKRESPIATVLAGAEAVKAAQPDLIVAVGGGSAIVTARAITIIVGEGKSLEEMYTRHVPGQPPRVYRANKPKIPNIQVATTPTTAADRGGCAIYDETPPHRKEIFDPKTRPIAIFVDPEALLTAPAALYLDTCLTTLVGLIGSLQSDQLSAFSYADYRQALELCLTYLPQLRDRPDDPHVRVQLFLATLLVNRASQSTYNVRGLSKTNGLERIIHYQYPAIGQGAANAVMLATNLRTNKYINTQMQAFLAEQLGVRRPGISDEDAAELAVLYVETFLRSLGVATRLRELNLPKDDCRRLAELDAVSPAFGQGLNRVTDVEELVGILEMAW
ncbi:MAG: iron-containing alcohol dehydrogenase [Dehalococcoidia bacterium]|nr:iron-containing alcohol dehydrogenase [Dehalococcoidia bacterium]